MRLAITGTPGVGKTTLAGVAARNGWRVVDVKAWAREAGAVVGHDELDGADVIDVEALAQLVPDDDGSRVAYEGHLSHLLPVDAAWVIRLDPKKLGPRLVARGYAPAKVLENLEAEALDLILQEALENVPAVVQRDATNRAPDALFNSFVSVPPAQLLRAPDLEPVDWSAQLPFAPDAPGPR